MQLHHGRGGNVIVRMPFSRVSAELMLYHSTSQRYIHHFSCFM